MRHFGHSTKRPSPRSNSRKVQGTDCRRRRVTLNAHIASTSTAVTRAKPVQPTRRLLRPRWSPLSLRAGGHYARDARPIDLSQGSRPTVFAKFQPGPTPWVQKFIDHANAESVQAEFANICGVFNGVKTRETKRIISDIRLFAATAGLFGTADSLLSAQERRRATEKAPGGGSSAGTCPACIPRCSKARIGSAPWLGRLSHKEVCGEQHGAAQSSLPADQDAVHFSSFKSSCVSLAPYCEPDAKEEPPKEEPPTNVKSHPLV